MDYPRMLFCDEAGRTYDEPSLVATARLGVHEVVPEPDEWIPLPEGSDLFSLPNRRPIGWDRKKERFRLGRHPYWAVSAFAPPGYLRSHLPNARPLRSARRLPLWAYSASGWREDHLCVAAFPIQHDPKGDLAQFDEDEICERIGYKLKAFPRNRLLRHIANCARNNNCLAAKNYFLERWEGGVPIAQECTSACEGCISHQPEGSSVPASHARITFRPTMQEALEVIIPHLEKAPLGMISFGQGCEGEPLCEAEFLEELIKEVRRQSQRGTLHMNTNGYDPQAVRQLARAGLDSIRISVNSAQEKYYHAYHKPKGYRFADVLRSAQIAVKEGLFVSINYLVFPGLTDHPDEIDSFTRLLEETQAHMVQWKNLNIDPDQYISCVGLDCLSRSLGMRRAVDTLTRRMPDVRTGYFNPPREHFAPAIN